MRDFHFYTDQPNSIVNEEKQKLQRLGNTIGIACVISILLPAFFGSILSDFTRFIFGGASAIHSNMPLSEMANQIYTMLSYVSSFLIPFGLAIATLGMTTSQLPYHRIRPSTTIGAVGVSLGAVLIGSLAVSVVSSLFGLFGYQVGSPATNIPTSFWGFFLYAVNICILPPLLEEFVFRGVILQSLRRFGDGFALLVTSLIFGMMHGNFVQMPYAVVLGYIIGFFVIKTGSIWTGVFIHFANNTISMVAQAASLHAAASGGKSDAMLMAIYLIAGTLGIMILNSSGARGILTPIHDQGDFPLKFKLKHFVLSPGVIGLIVGCLLISGLYVTHV